MRFLDDDEMEFFTDAATLAMFDPAILSERVNDEIDWWCDEFSDIAEVKSGEIALLSLSDDGHYKI